MHLQTRSIAASKCISRLDRSRPPSASLSSLHLGLPVHLQTRSITACKCFSEFTPSWPPSPSTNSIDHGLLVHLHTRSIAASKCISRLARLRPECSQNHGLHVHIPNLAQSQPPSVSPNTLDYRLQVHLQSRSITASEYISEFTRSSFSGTPRIALKLRLQPVQI